MKRSKKRLTKIISFFMAVIMLVTTVPLLFLASAKEVEEVKPTVDASPINVEVTTEKPRYTLLSVIKFNVRVTNNSDTDIENINIVAKLGEDLVFVKGSETTTLKDRLAPGESYEWSYKAKVSRDRLKSADKLLVPLAFMRDIFVSDYFNPNQNTGYGSYICENRTHANLISAYSNQYSSDSIVEVFYDYNSVEFGYLHTNPTNCEAGISSNVTFYIDVASDKKIENLELYLDNKLIGTLNDNGENGDNISDDGIYSGTFSVFSNERKHAQYYVKYKNQKSDTETLLFAKSWTDEEKKIIDSFYVDISKIKEKYTFSRESYNNQDEEALLKAEKCYNEIIEYLDSRTDIATYNFTGFNIMVMFKFEIPVGISFDDLIEDTDDNITVQSRSISKNINTSYNNVSSYKSKIITLQPHSKDLSSKAFDNAAETIADTNSYYVFKENLDDTQITVETMKSLSRYGVIILDSHGGNWEKYGYIMSLSEEVTETKNNEEYKNDIDEERIIRNGSNYVITEKFFDDYYSADDFDNTIIYLGTCHSGDDDVGIRHILNSKGAEAVMTYKNTVINKYNNEMITTISERLSKGDTIQDAVKKAKEKNGDHDPYISSETYNNLGFWDKLLYHLGLIESSNPAELVLTGNNTSFTLSKNPESELITGQVLDDISNKPISNVKISCDDLNLECYTDENGIFKFKTTLPLKQTTFVFSHTDYKNNIIAVEKNNYSILNTITLKPKNLEIPDTAVKFNGHYYQAYDTSMTWYEAKSYCETLGGHLVTITSEAENNFVFDLIVDNSRNYYWIGATDEKIEGQWEWITGEAFQYSNTSDCWADNAAEREDHAAILRLNLSGNAGEWNDFTGSCAYDSTRQFGFVCEWE